MNFRAFFIIVLICCVAFPALSQYREPSKRGGGLGDKIYFGGGGGFSGGTNFLNISVSPLVGYKITDRFSAGMQFTYQYVRFNVLDVNISNYGGGPFLRFNITEKFFTYSQYEYMNFGVSNSEERFDFSSLFVGIGYSEPISDKVAFNITALYNLLYQDGSNSPYQSPLVFRVGIVAGLF